MRILKTKFILLSLIGIVLGCHSGPKIEWQKFDEKIFQQALQSDKPTILYLGARWCGSCTMLQATTFRDPRLMARLENWNRLHLDVSNQNEQTLRGQVQFKIYAIPTVVLYTPSGREFFRKTGRISSDELIQITERIIS